MKKFFGILILIIMVLFIGFTVYRYIIVSIPPKDAPSTAETYLNETVDFKLLLYGEDIKFSKYVEYEKIDSIDKAFLADNDYIYLVINDLEGDVELSKKTFKKLVKYADENSNFNFYYLGSSKLKMIDSIIGDCYFNDDDLSFGYITYEGLRLESGFFHEDDYEVYKQLNEDLLGECIIETIYSEIKSNEQ